MGEFVGPDIDDLNTVLLGGVLAVARQDDLADDPVLSGSLGLDDDLFVKAEFSAVCAHGIQCSTKKEPPAEARGMVLREGVEPPVAFATLVFETSALIHLGHLSMCCHSLTLPVTMLRDPGLNDNSGKGRIRTYVGVTRPRFPSECHKPLGHYSRILHFFRYFTGLLKYVQN